MTCVVGISLPGIGAVLGFDSYGGSARRAYNRLDRKGAQLLPWLAFGYTTSYRFGQILQYHTDLKALGACPKDPHRWAVTKLVPEMRRALKEHGWLLDSTDREKAAGTVLVAVGDRILTIFDDLQVAETADGFDAIGSGMDEARAVLWATQAAARQRALLALAAAAYLVSTVRGPFHLLETTCPTRPGR